MWISKKKYEDIVTRLNSLEEKTKGVRVKIKNTAEPFYSCSHTYVSVVWAIQLIIEHLRLEYEPSKTSADKLSVEEHSQKGKNETHK